MKVSLGEGILLLGLLMLAWVVYTQQEEIAMLSEALGGLDNRSGMKPPPVPVQREGEPPEGALPTL